MPETLANLSQELVDGDDLYYAFPPEFNNDRLQPILMNIPVHTAHLQQSCISRRLTLNQALMDGGLITAESTKA